MLTVLDNTQSDILQPQEALETFTVTSGCLVCSLAGRAFYQYSCYCALMMVAKAAETSRCLMIYVLKYLLPVSFVGTLRKCNCSFNARIWVVTSFLSLSYFNEK